jgi:hypothetical protein
MFEIVGAASRSPNFFFLSHSQSLLCLSRTLTVENSTRMHQGGIQLALQRDILSLVYHMDYIVSVCPQAFLSHSFSQLK